MTFKTLTYVLLDNFCPCFLNRFQRNILTYTQVLISVPCRTMAILQFWIAKQKIYIIDNHIALQIFKNVDLVTFICKVFILEFVAKFLQVIKSYN